MLSMFLIVVALVCGLFSAAHGDEQQYLTITTTDGMSCDGTIVQQTRYSLGMCMLVDTTYENMLINSATFSTTSTGSSIYLRMNLFTDDECSDSRYVTTIEYDTFSTVCASYDAPTAIPTEMPSPVPTEFPTFKPSSAQPSVRPTRMPTFTSAPTVRPSFEPTEVPTRKNTYPTVTPTAMPSSDPSTLPTPEPSAVPTVSPTYGFNTLDDFDDTVPVAHSTSAVITTDYNVFNSQKGHAMSLSNAGTECGDDSEQYYYRWTAYDDFEPVCHRTTEIFLAVGEVNMMLNSSVTAGSTGPKGKVHCFAGSEVVTLVDGSVKSLREVRIGDSILSYNPYTAEYKFSPVIALPHTANTDQAEFIQLSTLSGKDIKLTADHLISASASCSHTDVELVRAADVSVDMCLLSVDSGLDRVKSVEVDVSNTGIYSVVAKDEYIVVNGFVASPFAVNHAVSNAYYNVVRAFPWLAQSSVLRKAGEVFGAFVDAVSN